MPRPLALACLALIALLPGCMGPTHPVLSLAPDQPAAPALVTATEPGTYHLYSSANEKKPIYTIELRKHEKFGFVADGPADHRRIDAVARGIQITLPDREDGATYTWRIEEKK